MGMNESERPDAYADTEPAPFFASCCQYCGENSAEEHSDFCSPECERHYHAELRADFDVERFLEDEGEEAAQ